MASPFLAGLLGGLAQQTIPQIDEGFKQARMQAALDALNQASTRTNYAVPNQLTPQQQQSGMLPTIRSENQPVPLSDPNYQNHLMGLAALNPTLASLAMQLHAANQPQFKEITPGAVYGTLNSQTGQFTKQGEAPFRPYSAQLFPYATAGNVQTIDENGIPTVTGVTIDKRTGQKTLTNLGKANPKATAGGNPDASGNWVQMKDAMGAPTGFINKVTKEVRPLSQYQGAQEITGAPLSSTTKTMVETAPKVQELVDKMRSQVDAVAGDKGADQLGPLAGRWNAFMTGKVGASDPQFNALRVNAGLLSTLLMRMHVGARGSEKIMEKFDNLIGLGHQSPENLKAALDQIQAYAQAVEAEKSGVGGTAKSAPAKQQNGKRTITLPDGTIVTEE